MSGPFVQAVTTAENNGGRWEFEYYHQHCRYHRDRQETYLQTRYNALGPEWLEWVRTCMRVRGELPFCRPLML